MTLWTPDKIRTALWLDASDSGTITTVSGLVSEWRDKSRECRNVVQTSSSYRPTYDAGNSRITFDGVNDCLIADGHYLFANAAEGGVTVFAVAEDTFFDGINTHFLFDFGSNAGAGIGMWFSTTVGGYSPVTYGGYGVSGNAPVAGGMHMCCFRTAFSNQSEMFFDGVLLDQKTITLPKLSPVEIVALRIRSPSAGPLTVGAQSKTDNQTNRYFKGHMHELIFVRGALTASERHIVEGYLAHKWGIEATLPTTHPFKAAAPQLLSVSGGVIDAEGNPASRIVRAYDRATGGLVGETISDTTTGAYELNGVWSSDGREIQRVVLDSAISGTIYNDLIDRVIPG